MDFGRDAREWAFWATMSTNPPQAEVRYWTQEQINFFSDVIAKGTVLKSEPVRETTVGEENAGVCLEITFAISHLFKGKIPSDGTIVVRHFLPAANANTAANGVYLLYLINDRANCFRPTTGPKQASLSIRPHLRSPTIESKRSVITRSTEKSSEVAVPAVRMARQPLELAAVP